MPLPPAAAAFICASIAVSSADSVTPFEVSVVDVALVADALAEPLKLALD
jgi:hypothetical protein